jgi:hypothetical protein
MEMAGLNSELAMLENSIQENIRIPSNKVPLLESPRPSAA